METRQVCFPAFDQVFQLMQTVGGTLTHLVDIYICKFDKDETGSWINYKIVLFIRANEEDVARSVYNIHSLDTVCTDSAKYRSVRSDYGDAEDVAIL